MTLFESCAEIRKEFRNIFNQLFCKKNEPFNILTGWEIENNISDLMITGLTENEVVFPIELPTYTVKLDLNLPFEDSRIGTVIINDVQYMKKEN